MLHVAPATAAVLLLAAVTPGCTPLSETTSHPSKATSPTPRTEQFTLVPEPRVETLIPHPGAKGTPVKSNSFAERIEAGTNPIFAAVPGTEKVILQQHANGPFTFRVPRRSSGEVLWVVVRCSQPSPVEITMRDDYGSVVTAYSVPSCRGNDAGGGTPEISSTHGEVVVDPGIHVDLTLISSDLRKF